MTISAPAYAALACNVCHTMPPLDSAAGDREPSSGAFKGNHQGHSSNSVDSCVPCHGAAVSSYKASHSAVPAGSGVNSVIVLTPALNNYSIGHTLATYSRGTFFNQTTVPPSTLGNCSNANCHFENTTPSWGTTNFAAPADCDKCHGAPPSGTSTGAAGSHAKHVLSYPGVTNCQKCHPNNTNFHHATSAGNRTLGISFAAAPNNGSGTYSGLLNDYLPSQDNAFGDCSATYCHGTTMNPNGGTDITPTWDTESSGQCGTCHGATATNPPLRGSHQTHAGNGEYTHAPGGLNDKIYGRAIACTVCHKTGSNEHVDGNADWLFDSTSKTWLSGAKYRTLSSGSISPVPSSTYGQCSNLYCHSIVQTTTGGPLTGLANEYKTPTWGNMDEGTCGSCHAVDLGHATWAGRAGAPEISSASHTKHLQVIGSNAGIGSTPGGPARCAVCHNYANSDDLLSCATVCHNAQSAHVNHQIEVKFAPRFGGATATYNGSPTPGSGFSGCSGTYCHSNGKSSTVFSANPSPNWGSGTMQCTGCHAGAMGSFNAISSGSHSRHISIYSYGCTKCHGVTAASNTTINDQSRHVNHAVEVAFNNTTTAINGKYNAVAATMASPSSKTPGSAYASCENTYCHSPGNKVSAFDNPKQVATWGGTLNCTGCHDPVTTPVTGSHYTHAYSFSIPCYKCHAATTTTLNAISNTANHVNRKVDIAFNNTTTAINGKYNALVAPVQKTPGTSYAVCENVYCHSNGQGAGGTWPPTYSTPTWGNLATGNCGTCHDHGYHASTVNKLASGSHTKHMLYTFSAIDNCAVCHYGGSLVSPSCDQCHDSNPPYYSEIFSSLHANGQVDVGIVTKYGGTYSGTPSPGDGYGTCASNYCHSPGTKSASYDAPNQAATWGGSLTCKGCHKADIASGSYIVTGSHGSHVNGFSMAYNTIKCVTCHQSTTTAGMTIADTLKHVNKKVEIAFDNTSSAANGSYNGQLAKPGSPSIKDPGTAVGSCTSVYCHSTGQSSAGTWPPVYQSPTWGTAATGRCGTCHGVDSDQHSSQAIANVIASGSHSRHLSYTFGMSDVATRCAACHSTSAGLVQSGCQSAVCHTNMASKHANYEVNIGIPALFGASASYSGTTKPGDGYSNCANSYCHSNGTSVATGTVPANTTVNWGTAGPLACNSCHGNATYGADFRKATPLYATGSPKGNAHALHIRTGSLSGVYMQCFNCHAATTRINTTIANTANHVNKAYNVASVYTGFSSAFRDGDNTMNSTKVTLTYNYNASGSSCSNVSCHPIGLDITTVPPAPKTRSTSTVKWNSSGTCIDCHNIDMQSTSTFHHAMRNYSAGYPLLSPYSSASTGVNVYARRCTMCHVDHNIFSNDLNSSNSLGRAGNLRTDIAVAPTAASGYSNKDYIKSGSGGICISCHNTAKAKDTTRRKNDYPANVTPIVTQAQYSGSGHQYDVTAKFMSDGSVVYGNCSKCHNALLNETSVFMNATSTYQFGNHNSGVRRLQGTLDAAGGETAEEQICYRCHSLITDADPGGGPPKALANKDFYGVAPMSLASQDIFDANLDFRAASATSTTNKLYFKPSAAESPAEAMPNQHNTGDTFAGGTWIGRAMSPWETTTAYETKSQVTNTTGTNYWRMVTFTSPKVYSTTTVPAGNWMINVYCRESSTAQNAKIRYMVYKWNDPADTMGATIITKGTYLTELATTAAPGAVRQIAVSVPATTLNAGEKIVVDLELDTTSSYTTAYTASFYFGSHAPSDLTLPGNVIWNYAAPAVAGYGHATQHYVGIHLPSTKNETLAYIAQNKHIECVDCHNPHATRNGLHGDYGIATGGSSTTLVNSTKQWVPNQWTGAFVSLIPTTPSTTAPISTITSNTATTLTTTPYSGTWVAPVNGSVYRIIKNTNKVSNSQRGVPGASVSYSGAWTAGTYSMVEEATYEYQICFKCHVITNATTNSLRYWNVTSASLGAARWTNVGLEFNPNNVSYHPVVQPLPTTGTPRRLEAGALTGGWKSGDVMSCSDCHGRDTSTSATAQGPHGSTVKWLLTGKYQNWPFTSAAANGTSAGGTFLAGTGTSTYPSSNFCFNCHTWAAGGNAHVKSINHVVACVVCHIRVPHGGKVPRLLTGTNAPSRYKPDGNGGGSTFYLTSAKLPATGYMLKTDISCSKTCGQHPAFPVAGAYYW